MDHHIEGDHAGAQAEHTSLQENRLVVRRFVEWSKSWSNGGRAEQLSAAQARQTLFRMTSKELEHAQEVLGKTIEAANRYENAVEATLRAVPAHNPFLNREHIHQVQRTKIRLLTMLRRGIDVYSQEHLRRLQQPEPALATQISSARRRVQRVALTLASIAVGRGLLLGNESVDHHLVFPPATTFDSPQASSPETARPVSLILPIVTAEIRHYLAVAEALVTSPEQVTAQPATIEIVTPEGQIEVRPFTDLNAGFLDSQASADLVQIARHAQDYIALNKMQVTSFEISILGETSNQGIQPTLEPTQSQGEHIPVAYVGWQGMGILFLPLQTDGGLFTWDPYIVPATDLFQALALYDDQGKVIATPDVFSQLSDGYLTPATDSTLLFMDRTTRVLYATGTPDLATRAIKWTARRVLNPTTMTFEALAAIPADVLNASIPPGAENSTIVSRDGHFYRSVPFDMPDSPRYVWNEATNRWHDQNPGRNEYERLLPGGTMQELAQVFGSRIVGWNQAALAYQRDDGALFYPGLGTKLSQGNYDNADLSDGWIWRSDALISSDFEAGTRGLDVELGIAVNHPIYDAISFDSRVTSAARDVIAKDILTGYPNLAGKKIIVQVVADDVTHDVFQRPGGVGLFVKNEFATGSSNLGSDILFIRLSVTLDRIERTDLYFGLNAMNALIAALDEYTHGTKRNPMTDIRLYDFYNKLLDDNAKIVGDRFDLISPTRK